MARRSKRRIAVLDIETDPFKYGRLPKPFAVGFYDGVEYINWWGKKCIESAAVFLSDYDCICYAHHGGKFDWFYFWDFIELSYDINQIKAGEHFMIKPGANFQMINGRIAIANIGHCEIRDSFLILPFPLAAYSKDEINYDKFEEGEREKKKNKKEILAYLKSDCLYLYDIVKGFTDRFGSRLTIASAGFAELKKTGYNTQLKTSKEYDETFRPFYFGGRTQAIKVGTHRGHFKYYDINSAYSLAMLNNHPYGPKCDHYTGDDLGQELPDNEVYFAKILAKSRCALPVRHEKTKAVDFPFDDKPREYLVTSWEIRAGLETGTLEIEKIIDVYIHENVKDLGDYVRKFYAEKQQAEKGSVDYLLSKTMQNAPYGKFGQNGEEFREYFILPSGYNPLTESDREMAKQLGVEPGDYLVNWLGWECDEIVPNGLEIWSRPDPIDYFYNVATAASITGFVRAYLWRAICAAKNVLYCDTDSMICEHADIKISNELGDWKLEAETWDTVYIGGKKLYTFIAHDCPPKNGYFCYADIHKAHKGARLSYEQIKEVVENGKELTWYNEAPSFSIKFGVLPNGDITDNKHAFIHRTIKTTGKK